jgi:glycerophosphoryl diester phosphodiesterase
VERARAPRRRRWHSRHVRRRADRELRRGRALLPRNAFALDIEIKPRPAPSARPGASSREPPRALARRVAAAAAQLVPPPRSRRAREAAAAAARARCSTACAAAGSTRQRALGCVAVVLAHALVDAAVLATLRGAGLFACVYTVNDPADARRVDALGIDGIVTDAVDRFSPAGAIAD